VVWERVLIAAGLLLAVLGGIAIGDGAAALGAVFVAVGLDVAVGVVALLLRRGRQP
jgi:hypothetical protein